MPIKKSDQKNDVIFQQRKMIQGIMYTYDILASPLAKRCGISHSTIIRLLNDDAPSALSTITVSAIIKIFRPGVKLTGLLQENKSVITELSKPHEIIETPLSFLEAGIECIKVTGTAGWPTYKDGDVVFYIAGNHLGNDIIGKDCVVTLENGERHIGELQAGATKDHWILMMVNRAPRVDIKLASASPVRWVKKP